MDQTLSLLKAMASPQSGISEYWRARVQNLINQVQQEPRNYCEIVE